MIRRGANIALRHFGDFDAAYGGWEGTTRMGDHPKKSVVNRFNQAHDAKNVFVVDGGPFVSQADKNPTWTILAMSMRASEFIIDQIKKQNLV